LDRLREWHSSIMLPHTLAQFLLIASLTGACHAITHAAPPAGSTLADMEAAFQTPPVACRPSIWWFWGETVTTDAGITRDLEALQRAGFGGVVIYEQVFTDRPGALKSLSPEWLARVRHAATECARLGLTLEVNVSNGYIAGGPWITPDLAMQRLIASETTVEGGRSVTVSLPKPVTRSEYLREVAVLAYPTPAGAGPQALPEPRRSCSETNVDLSALFSTDGRGKARIAPQSPGQSVHVVLDYGQPVTVRSLSYTSRATTKGLVIATQMPTSWADDFLGQGMRAIPPLGRVEASDDGTAWRAVADIPAFGQQHDGWTHRTAALPATRARYFRLALGGADELTIGGVALRGEARVDQWEHKSGNVAELAGPDRTPAYLSDEVINPARIVDLTSRMAPDGTLTWDAPPGSWSVLRLAHTPTGARTKHGRPEGIGYECDKLSAAGVRVQFSNYVGTILREVRTVPGARLAGVNIDSAEHGSQNWTRDFEAQFEKRRGYSPRRLLPAMMGRVVGSAKQSDAFLFDVRRTIADLMSDEYFGEFQRLCRAEGMTSMAQAPGLGTCLPSDHIQAKGRADIPMGEFWMSQRDGTMDCKEAASAGHVYGLPVIAAEAFTGSRADIHPNAMRPFAHAALALGINRFVTLAYVHQPWDDRKPGVTEDRFYLPYQRHNTWWEEGAGFWHFIGRSSHLMRQGRPVVDLLYHLGNDTPLKIVTHRMRPVPPRGYDYDVCGDEVLLQRVSARDGRIVLPDGMSYTLLVLAGGERMTLAAARQVRALLQAGATVLGPVKPTGSPSLADGPEGDAEVRRIADELWGAATPAPQGERRLGTGTLLWGLSPEDALARAKTPRDFEVVQPAAPVQFLHAHRRTDYGDIYFVANHGTNAARITAAFRVTGRVPERWDPLTGARAALDGFRETNGRTEVPLTFEAGASAFIVFREASAPVANRPAADSIPVAELPVLQSINGPWDVRFESGRGAPDRVAFPALTPWNEHPDAGVRAFSGSAVYSNSFTWTPPANPSRVLLDLGLVAVLADVTLNGRNLGVTWAAPYAVDVTDTLRPGTNTLAVRVVNTWVNRLITDTALPEAERITWVTYNPYRPGERLHLSGLLGPVALRSKPAR
jgi:hypothetical protein